MTLAKRILAGIALVALTVLVHTLDYRVQHFEEVESMAELGPQSPGCIGDMLTGLLLCSYRFADGSWIVKRGY